MTGLQVFCPKVNPYEILNHAPFLRDILLKSFISSNLSDGFKMFYFTICSVRSFNVLPQNCNKHNSLLIVGASFFLLV